MSDDFQPEKWHPQWIRYAAYGEWALILHYSNSTTLCQCKVKADLEPSINHQGIDFYPGWTGVESRHFLDVPLEAAIAIWETEAEKLRQGCD